ncbi:MAG: putative bifunctional diguanylate cyclase/phosphodiesterase [Trichloromonadaceae bacterium]
MPRTPLPRPESMPPAAMLEHWPQPTLLLDQAGNVVLWNAAAEKLLAWSSAEVLGQPPPISALTVSTAPQLPLEEILRKGGLPSLSCFARHRDGHSLAVQLMAAPIHSNHNSAVAFMLMLETPVTLPKGESCSLSANHFAREALDALPQHIAILDAQGTILSVNKAWRQFAEGNGGKLKTVCEGANYLSVCQAAGAEGCQEGTAFLQGIRAVIDGVLLEFSLEYSCHTPERPSWYMGVVTAMAGPGQARVVVAHENITQLKQAENAIERLAYYDSLTKLPNRWLFQDRLSQTLAQARRENQLVGLVFLDLDRFKNINDTLGHSAGDELLKEVAHRLKSCIRRSDTIARLGGDEFVIILPAINQTEDATLIASKILQSFSPAVELEGREVFITTSIGIAIYPNDGQDSESLVRNADTAMYQAKERGRNNYQFFSPEMNRKVQEFLNLETSLRRALNRQEFLLHYQGIYDLATGVMIGVEALLRWQHPEWGLVYPLEFLPVAEETGLIQPLGDWVLATAVGQWRNWQRSGFAPPPMTVRLAQKQARHPRLLDTIGRALETNGMQAEYLVLRLGPTTLGDSDETLQNNLKLLRALGVQLFLDDFGAEETAFATLRQHQVDGVKIDQSLVRDLPADTDAAAIVHTVIDLAHARGIRIIAEGIVDEDQLEFLRKQLCDGGQGYLFGRPQAASDFSQQFARSP